MKRFQSVFYHGIALLLTAFLLALARPTPALAAEKTARQVRIGYYPIAEYQDHDAQGGYSGFGYDYYVQIQKYTGWDYVFVEENYAKCMEMLAAGELDVVSGVIPSDARREKMSFSRYSISNTQNKIYARTDDENCFYESYDAFDGRRAAILRGTLTDGLHEYEEQHGFGLELKEYDSLTEMEDALFRGEVDLVYATSIAETAKTKIVARLSKIPLYYAVSKDAPEVLSELDDALQKIIDNNPYFYTQLSEKYMVSGANAIATFTKEEYDYIHAGRPVYVILNDSWAPICWYDKTTQSYRGIVPDVLERLGQYSGLQFIRCSESEFEALAAKDPSLVNDVLAILADDNAWAARQKVMMTNRIVNSAVVLVTKRSTHQTTAVDKLRFALPERYYVSWKVAQDIPEGSIAYYPTVEACLDAINEGRADATFVNELSSTYYLSMLEYSDLFATPDSGSYSENLAFAINQETDAPLLGILDKSILCIGSAELNQIVIQNSVAEQRVTLTGLFYSNPVPFLFVTVVLLVTLFSIAALILYLRAKRRRLQRELKQEQENASARTEFFMMISHELRTPLNAIVGYLEMAAELCTENAVEREYLRRSAGAAKQLTEVAEDMLDYTRITSSGAELHAELFDLKKVVRHTAETASLDAEKRGVSFQFKVSDLDYEFVVGDRLRVAQIMQNLLSNSVKFTPPGGAVEASLSETMRADGTLELSFTAKDTGKGMSREFLKKVCAPFNQSDPSYSRTHGGLGLGLFLTKYYLDAMGGRLAVESELEKGSTFTAILPLTRASSEQILKENMDYSRVRALIGGADAEANQALKALLKRLKMKCDTVESAKLAARRAKSRLDAGYPYSLCVLDENLLEKDNALIAELQALQPAPTVFVMTDGRWQPTGSGLTAACRVLSKPIFQSALFDAVMSSFGGYEPEEKYILPDYSGLHAMIVEDNSVNADILSNMLQKMKLKTTVCENGQLAVDAFAQNPAGTFDIIFMDIQMPVLNGYAATEQIRGCTALGGEAVPIVAVSANAFPEDREKSLQAGMNEHLAKPVTVSRIGAVIGQYCHKNAAE